MKKTLLITLSSVIITLNSNAQTLESYYSFNDSTTNDQVGDNHGINSGATPTNDRFGNPNMAMHFDGASNIEVGDSSEVNLNNLSAITISCWVRQDTFYSSTANLMGIVTKWTGSSTTEQYGLYSKQDDHLFAVGSIASGGFTLNGNIDSTWTHIVVSYDVTGNKVDYYINGTLVTSINTGSFPGSAGTSPLFIGSQSQGRFYVGDIDDVKIYSTALDSAQVVTLYNEANPVAPIDGINNVFSNSINIYPNPTNGLINISTENTLNNVRILDFTGRVILTSKSKTIDLTSFENGIYFVEVKTNKGMSIKKVVKQ